MVSAEDRQGQQQVTAVGLGFGRVARHGIGDGEQPHGQHQGRSLQQPPGHVAEKQQAADAAEERDEPQRVFVEAQELDHGQLPPEEERGATWQ